MQTLRDKVPDQECQICLLDFNKGDRVTWYTHVPLLVALLLVLLVTLSRALSALLSRMDCFCVFHEECIETWFKKVSHRECPVHKDD